MHDKVDSCCSGKGIKRKWTVKNALFVRRDLEEM